MPIQKITNIPMGTAPQALEFSHFPTKWQAFIWRNWEYFSANKLAEILGCTGEIVKNAAYEMGLFEQEKINEKWLNLSYQTIIRNNWHILNYSQLLQLLGWDAQKLVYTLKEEDFLWSKMGRLKPNCYELKYHPLSPEEQEATNNLKKDFRKHFPTKESVCYIEQPFSFAKKYKPCSVANRNNNFELNIIHSYPASCGDIFIDIESNDPAPENLLSQYASLGIKAVWVHAILYRLHPIKGAEEFSGNFEKRLKNLKTVVERCKKYGIEVFLYLNEPRGMRAEFYEKLPHWRGLFFEINNMYSNCTSSFGPLEYVTEGCFNIFKKIPNLGGAFFITMSENVTHCNYSRLKHKCPKCQEKTEPQIIASIIRAAQKGIRAASSTAKIIVSDWAWGANDKDIDPIKVKCETIDLLPNDVWFMTVSEWGKNYNIQGVKSRVYDYSISQIGPSEESKIVIKHAQARNLKTIAKIQINNTWELSAIPYIPVPYLIEEHLANLKKLNIDGLMLSWTLGGYPGGNINLLNLTTEELAYNLFSPNIAKKVCQAWRLFSDGFSCFPFSILVAYTAPMNFGSMNLLYLEPTKFKATMIGFPYDDLTSWRDIYPEEIFIEQFKKLSEKWNQGLNILEDLDCKSIEQLQEINTISKAAYCHLYSSYLQMQFVKYRDQKKYAELKNIIDEELNTTKTLFELARMDSRIGFEASNHYYYSLNNLIEKIVNCEYIKRKYQNL